MNHISPNNVEIISNTKYVLYNNNKNDYLLSILKLEETCFFNKKFYGDSISLLWNYLNKRKTLRRKLLVIKKSNGSNSRECTIGKLTTNTSDLESICGRPVRISDTTNTIFTIKYSEIFLREPKSLFRTLICEVIVLSL